MNEPKFKYYNFKYYDKTHLDIYDAYQQGLIHRDYIAHCHRWSFIVNYLEKRDRRYKGDERYKHTRILDVGCGKQVPLFRTLCANRLSGVESYTGVDVNNLQYAHDRFVESKRKTKPVLLGDRREHVRLSLFYWVRYPRCSRNRC